MTEFRFRPVVPHALLAPYIAKMWCFESSGRLPADDKKLIVPNANFKLAYTYSNGIAAMVGNKMFIQNEGGLTLTGMVDTPVLLDSQHDIPTGTIVIEFNPLGAYRLFNVSFKEIKNQIVELSDLLGNYAERLRLRLGNADRLEEKINLLQSFLLAQLAKSEQDTIFEYCVQRIARTNGTASVAQLEKETGYSARWLHKKFTEQLGTGPKNLAEIIRFKQFYQVYSAGAGPQIIKDEIYSHYHDRSHFIRTFKRFTGHTPTDLQNSMNELAIRHYTS